MEINENSLIMNLFATTRVLRKIVNEFCKKYGVNSIQLGIIVLASKDNMTVSKLAEVLEVSKSAISQALIKLFVKKYITKKMAEDNKKVFYVKNLSKGKQIKEEIVKVLNEEKDKINNKMGTDSELFSKLLIKYNKIIKEINEKGDIEKC